MTRGAPTRSARCGACALQVQICTLLAVFRFVLENCICARKSETAGCLRLALIHTTFSIQQRPLHNLSMQCEDPCFPAEDHHLTSEVHRIRQEPHGAASRFHSWTADVKINEKQNKGKEQKKYQPITLNCIARYRFPLL